MSLSSTDSVTVYLIDVIKPVTKWRETKQRRRMSERVSRQQHDLEHLMVWGQPLSSLCPWCDVCSQLTPNMTWLTLCCIRLCCSILPLCIWRTSALHGNSPQADVILSKAMGLHPVSNTLSDIFYSVVGLIDCFAFFLSTFSIVNILSYAYL